MKRLILALVLFAAFPAHACQKEVRAYNTAATVNFCLYTTDATVGAVKVENASHASGDTYIMKDEGAEGNTTNAFVDEGSCYSIALTATEMQAARIVLNIEDQSTKTWADKCISIETFGHASAQFPTADVNVVSLAADAVTASAIAANAIGASELADNAIDAGAIATDAITAAKIAADSIGASELADNAVDAGAIAADAVGASELADNAVDAGAIATDAITATEIAADAIGASELAAGAIAAAEIATDAIDADAIAGDAIGASELAANAIGATEIADASIDAAALASDTITAAKIAADSIGSAEISSAAGNKVADHVWRRTNANIEASSDGDTLTWQSAYGAVAKQTNVIGVSGGNLIIRRADGSTVFKSQPLTSSSGAAPITGIGN